MIKYTITFLSTCLALSFMLYFSELECNRLLKENDKLSNQIIGIMATQLQELE